MSSEYILHSNDNLHPEQTDFVQAFTIDRSVIRGRVVRLQETVQTILSQHRYPVVICDVLAQMMLVAAMLSSNLKASGILTLEIRGSQAVKFMVVDAAYGGKLRGYARLSTEAHHRRHVHKLGRRRTPVSMQELVGEGYICITLDRGRKTQPYQGVIALPDADFSHAVREYFTQSQQVDMDMRLVVQRPAPRHGIHGWAAGGMFIERMPDSGSEPDRAPGKHHSAEEAEDLWERSCMFLESCTPDELLSPHLSGWDLLRRLFGMDGVWAYAPQPLMHACRCSRERVRSVLQTLDRQELASLVKQGKITVRCEFCGNKERFTLAQVTRT